MGNEAEPFLDERLWDQLSDALLLVEDGLVVSSNRAAQQLFGYTEAEFRSVTVEDLVPEASRVDHSRNRAKFVRQSMTRGIDHAGVFESRNSDGNPLWLRIALIPAQNADQTIVVACEADRRSDEQVQGAGSMSYDERENLVQSIFATGLLLRRSDGTPVSDARIDQVIESLDYLIADLAKRQLDEMPEA